MDKPIEFWICSPDTNSVGIDNNAVVWHRKPSSIVSVSYPVFHVIEYSAYAELEAKLRIAEGKLEKYENK